MAAPPPRRRRGPDAATDVNRTAGRLGLLGSLGIEFDDFEGEGGGGAFAADLFRSHHERSVQAWDLPRVQTALTWFEGFLVTSDRIPFVPAFGAEALRGQLHNRLTLDLFAEFMRRSTPMGTTRGDRLSSDAITSYVGVIRSLRSREARYDIAPDEVNVNLPLAAKSMRRDDPPPGERALELGMRARTIAEATERGLDRCSPQGVVDHAGALTGHNCVLRGGELGVPDGVEPDRRRIISWQSLTWQRRRLESRQRPWVIVRVSPRKDINARAKPYPCPVARRHDGPLGADPLCTYDALALAWWRRRAPADVPFPVDAAGRPAENWWVEDGRWTPRPDAPQMTRPFFERVATGGVFTTAYVGEIARRIGRAAGMSAEEVARLGGKSFRIGGATDYRASLGDESGRLLLKQRGRWDSDCDLIYARPLVASHLDASAAVGGVVSADLEALCQGWAQPATR